MRMRRAVAALVNANDTAALRTAFEAAAEWDRQMGPGTWLADPGMWLAGAVRGDCTGGQASGHIPTCADA